MIFIKLVLRIYSNALTTNGNPVRVKKLFLQLILLNLVFSANHLGADTDITVIDRNSDVEDIGGISLLNQPKKVENMGIESLKMIQKFSWNNIVKNIIEETKKI